MLTHLIAEYLTDLVLKKFCCFRFIILLMEVISSSHRVIQICETLPWVL